MKPIHIIVAMDEKRGIGKNNQLPWHLPSDLKHFKELTCKKNKENLPNAVVMGRKTWESLPEGFKPLPGRVNVVLTRQEDYKLSKGVQQFNTFDEAITKLNQSLVHSIFIIGGQQIFETVFKKNINVVLYVTHIEGDFACDTFFPPFEKEFSCAERSQRKEEKGIGFTFAEYKKC